MATSSTITEPPTASEPVNQQITPAPAALSSSRKVVGDAAGRHDGRRGGGGGKGDGRGGPAGGNAARWPPVPAEADCAWCADDSTRATAAGGGGVPPSEAIAAGACSGSPAGEAVRKAAGVAAAAAGGSGGARADEAVHGGTALLSLPGVDGGAVDTPCWSATQLHGQLPRALPHALLLPLLARFSRGTAHAPVQVSNETSARALSRAVALSKARAAACRAPPCLDPLAGPRAARLCLNPNLQRRARRPRARLRRSRLGNTAEPHRQSRRAPPPDRLPPRPAVCAGLHAAFPLPILAFPWLVGAAVVAAGAAGRAGWGALGAAGAAAEGISGRPTELASAVLALACGGVRWTDVGGATGPVAPGASLPGAAASRAGGAPCLQRQARLQQHAPAQHPLSRAWRPARLGVQLVCERWAMAPRPSGMHRLFLARRHRLFLARRHRLSRGLAGSQAGRRAASHPRGRPEPARGEGRAAHEPPQHLGLRGNPPRRWLRAGRRATACVTARIRFRVEPDQPIRVDDGPWIFGGRGCVNVSVARASAGSEAGGGAVGGAVGVQPARSPGTARC
eukprot:scaffold7616_cov100-Isochrysis_galbana.AAC.3